MATIDQFLSMSKYRHLSNLRNAYRCVIIAYILCSTHSILFLIYIDASFGSCVIVNPNFVMYVSHFYYPVCVECLPIGTMLIFSVFAYYNVRTLTS